MRGVSGVYVIVNEITGDRYVGSSVNLAARWSKHRCDLRKKRHGNPNLQQAWDVYGAKSFRIEILALEASRDRLIATEQQFLDQLRPEYNRSPSAGSNRGMSHSARSKENIARSISGEKNPWYGKIPPCAGAPHSKATKEKISASRIGEKNPMFGVRGPMAKLSDGAVREIKEALAGGVAAQSLADQYGVSKGAIQHIKKGRSYRDVKP